MLKHTKRVKTIFKAYIQHFKDYWIGSVDVFKQYIYSDKWPEKKRLHTISIISDRFGKGAWFREIPANRITELMDMLSKSAGSKFTLHLDYGGVCYLEYTFNRRQKSMLLNKLNEILSSEIIYCPSE